MPSFQVVLRVSDTQIFCEPSHSATFEFFLLAHMQQTLLASKINSHILQTFVQIIKMGGWIIKALNANRLKLALGLLERSTYPKGIDGNISVLFQIYSGLLSRIHPICKAMGLVNTHRLLIWKVL